MICQPIALDNQSRARKMRKKGLIAAWTVSSSPNYQGCGVGFLRTPGVGVVFLSDSGSTIESF